jgi:NAD(P)-dependent dehydrogenase (short-subunit alcohol dehydrogenase family)
VRVRDKTVVVTGGGHGIGRAIAERFVADGAAQVVVSDLDAERASEVGEALGMPAIACDVAEPAALEALISTTESEVGPIDLFVSNAAYGFLAGDRTGGMTFGLEISDREWEVSWQANVMAHVRAARQLVPLMLARGGGYFLQTVSAAGLITSNSPLAYTVTKHADIGFAEWLALNYGPLGIGVSCLCPTAVATRPGQFDDLPEIGIVQSPAEVADIVVEGLAEQRFLILPNPAVGGSFRKKANDYDGWIEHTQRRLAKIGHSLTGSTPPVESTPASDR